MKKTTINKAKKDLQIILNSFVEHKEIKKILELSDTDTLENAIIARRILTYPPVTDIKCRQPVEIIALVDSIVANTDYSGKTTETSHYTIYATASAATVLDNPKRNIILDLVSAINDALPEDYTIKSISHVMLDDTRGGYRMSITSTK